MRKQTSMILVLLAVVALVSCGDDTPTSPRTVRVPVPFDPAMFSGPWAGSMTAGNGVSISAANLTIQLQEGVIGAGEWSGIGIIGVPGSSAAFLIYRGEVLLSVQPDNTTLIGRWTVEVIDPDTDAVLCLDSAPLRGSMSTSTAMSWASSGFTECNSLPGVAPIGVAVDWTKLAAQ